MQCAMVCDLHRRGGSGQIAAWEEYQNQMTWKTVSIQSSPAPCLSCCPLGCAPLPHTELCPHGCQ